MLKNFDHYRQVHETVTASENKTSGDYNNSFWMIQMGSKVLRRAGKERKNLGDTSPLCYII